MGRGGDVMPADESITRWIALLKEGDPAAAQRLWERYFRRLVGHSVRRGSPDPAAPPTEGLQRPPA
jgi:hypothetical protein